ncbi:MAG: flagellar hook-associated protein FlgL [Desulfotalea sp.]
MRVTDASTYRLLQTNLTRTENGLQDLYNMATTGLKLNKASDDPSSITPVLSLRNQLILSERFKDTLGVAGDEMKSTDSFLNSSENIYQRLSEISVNAINSSLNQKDLNTLADEVSELKKQMLDVANAQIDGEYIFAGYSVTKPPFTENPNYDPALYDESDNSTWPITYNGDHNRTTLEIGESEYLQVNLTGNELFSGVANSEWSSTGTNGLQGESLLSSGTVTPSVPPFTGQNIVIEYGDNTMTIPESFLTANPADTNYAQTLSNLLENAPTNVGDMSQLTNFSLADADTYDFTVTNSAGVTVGIQLDGNPGQEFTLQGMSNALATTAGISDLQPAVAPHTSGTLSNGIKYDITTGELLFSAPVGDTVTTSDSIVDNENFGDLGAALANINPLSSYNLDVANKAGESISVTLDSSTGFTNQDMANALGATATPPIAAPVTSGTLDNGISFDISTGELIFSAPAGDAVNTTTTINNGIEITNLGDVSASGAITNYDLDIANSAGVTVTANLTPPFTNQTMADALGDLTGTTTVGTPISSGTLSNGVMFDISSGELLLTAAQDDFVNTSKSIDGGAATTTPSSSATLDLDTDLANLGAATTLETYKLEIANNSGHTISVALDGSAGKEFTSQAMADALGATLSPPLSAPVTSGTLDNGITFDVTSGDLVLNNPSGDGINTKTIINGGTAVSSPILTSSAPGVSPGTGLDTNITPATNNFGSDPAAGAAATYDLDITSAGSTVSINLAAPFTSLNDIGEALGNQLTPPDPTALMGTLNNGVSYDISSGELVLTGNDDGTNLVTSTNIDAAGATTNTTYGTVDVHTNTIQDATLSGAGLAGAGLEAEKLDGSTTIDIFGVLTQLEESLRAGNLKDPVNTGGGVERALANLKVAADQNRINRSQLGVKAKRVDESINIQSLAMVDFKTTLSRYEDANITELFSDITKKETALQATLKVVGRVSSISILDYI